MKLHIRAKKMVVSHLRKLVTQSFTFFENKNYTIKISFTMGIVELFTACPSVTESRFFSLSFHYFNVMKWSKAEVLTDCVTQVPLHMLKVSCNSKFLFSFYDWNIYALRNHTKWNWVWSSVQRIIKLSSTINLVAKLLLQQT